MQPERTQPSDNSQAPDSSTQTSDAASRDAPPATVPQRVDSSLKSRKDSRAAGDSNPEEFMRRVYGFSDLSGFRLRDRLIIRAADVFFFLLIRIVCSTLQWEVRGGHHFDSILASGHRAIFTFWHKCIFCATWFWRDRGIVVMSSKSRDAEYTGRFIKRFGYGTARGSATRGGRRALAEMAQCLTSGIHVGFTIDGPRGPAFVAKPGAVTLARHTGQAILPFHIATRRYMELPSWDRLQIPLPFTHALALIGEPIYVPRDATGDEIATRQRELQDSLDRLRQEAASWLAR